ncbi:MAG: glycosyltransferase family 2 protein [Cyanobacteria bacterium P01_A01_bin.40]
MSQNNPLISIGMPVYNGANFIREAFDSILSQTYENFELIISDNASTDETEKICREYMSQDSRFRYYRSQQNLGAAWNFNRVFDWFLIIRNYHAIKIVVEQRNIILPTYVVLSRKLP